MRRTILLLATIALALLLVGGVATSKQQQDESTSSSQPATTLSPTSEQSGGEDAAASQSTTTPPAIGQQGTRQQGAGQQQSAAAPATDKGSGDVSIESSSTTPKASFASGTGENRLSVKVSDHGNLMSFESPALQEAVIEEGYVVCSDVGTFGIGGVHAHDTGSVEGGFGTPTFVQPNGSGTFPLTVTRNTTDGKFQLKQLWAKPDAAEKDVTLTMTLTNRSSATIGRVILSRTGDFDVGPSFEDQGAATSDSAWLWDDVSGTETPPGGLMMTALTFGTINDPAVEPLTSWTNQTNPSRTQCFGTSPNTPVGEGDWTLRMISGLGNLSAGQSKSVKLSYSRM